MSSRSVNEVTLIGNLGRDAELKYTKDGVPVTRFSIATTRSWKDKQSGEWKQDTNWTNAVLWRQEAVVQYLTKGKQVYIKGYLKSSEYVAQDGKKVYTTDVIVEDVMLLGGNGAGSGARSNGAAAGAAAGAGGGDPNEFGVSMEDVPF